MTITAGEIDAARSTDLRREVLRPHWAPGTPMHGDDLADAVHIGAVDGDTVVGACVLQPAPYPHGDEPGAWQLRGMATAEGRRGEGIGAVVLDAAVEAVRARDGQFLWCKAREVAVAFYERNGFTVGSPRYVEPQTGLPHHDMYRRLA
ncbi:GNAT family N-acetyltransferase [uncultured Jatrophihabitans sp.]|uniref:GNAT family N-acetyltransferase n=1 Tax=uncultured Jatrophihabitans sp. TaxID=1610747 RepID=UPI0035CAF3F2